MCTSLLLCPYPNTATQVVDVTASVPNVIALKGTPTVALTCVTVVSDLIGPNYSPLSVRWFINSLPVGSGLTMVTNPQSNSPLQTSFMSTLEVVHVAETSTGDYCCTASLSGVASSKTACTVLNITGES